MGCQIQPLDLKFRSRQLLVALVMTHLNQMSAVDLRQRLLDLGEDAPKGWSKAQLRWRLTQIEGEPMEPVGPSVSPFRAMEIKINQAARRKSVLQDYMRTELGMTLTGSETVPVLQTKALERAFAMTPAHPKDMVGFGRHSSLSYEEVLIREPTYCRWVMETHQEGDACPRLQRLAMWLETQNVIQKAATNVTKGYMTSKTKVNKESATGSADVTNMLADMMKTMEHLTQEVTELKKHDKESKRKTNHNKDGATSSDWEQPTSA